MTSIGEEVHQLLELCDLPDEIIICILKLLPTTEDAVRTCLLLLRRNEQHYLWKSLTSLKFHQPPMFLLRGNPFFNFVERVMDLRDHSVPLLSFSLRCKIKSHDNVDRVTTWITKAVQCNVEDLTLSLDNYNVDDLQCLQCSIFGCQSLVKLELASITFNAHSSVIWLPHLKYLSLILVSLVNVKSTEKLLSSPLLEELIIDHCYWCVQSIRVYCSPKLQVLKIYNNYEHERNISIIGDNLKQFYYMGNLINEYSICASSTQLSKVEINDVSGRIGHGQFNYVPKGYEILKGLSKTQNLALSDDFLKGLQKYTEFQDSFPIFECLTQLDIRVYKKNICIDDQTLMKIYERCPRLEYLNIGKLSHIGRSLQLSPTPLCFQTHLKKILVHYYVPGDDEADFAIDVLLNSALVLEELVIYCKRDRTKGFPKIQELHDRLDRRPRASKDCIISVRGEDYTKRSGSSRFEDYIKRSGSSCFKDYIKSSRLDYDYED